MTQKAQAVAAGVATDVIAGQLAPGEIVPPVRQLAQQAGCSPGTAARAHALLREAGIITGRPRSHAGVAVDGVTAALAMSAQVGRLRLSGSDDPALDELVSVAGTSVERVAGGRGSVAGLSLLAQGTVEAAAIHLRDAQTGQHNDNFARRAIGGDLATLVQLWRRKQGIVAASNTSMGIWQTRDLAGRRLA